MIALQQDLISYYRHANSIVYMYTNAVLFIQGHLKKTCDKHDYFVKSTAALVLARCRITLELFGTL